MEYRIKSTRGDQWSAERVRALRAHLGLTQQQLSAELGTRQQTISEWERGLYHPRGTSRTILNLIAERAGFKYEAASPEEAETTLERMAGGTVQDP
ncbi:MAG: helix-turn-helix transcriptional regulator [Chloroflexi bacterium]|nr:helix-turn-helix transcriptional regulator [Chloroflexota bacterium]